jgi:cytochrome c-type biogenesis protein CcmE
MAVKPKHQRLVLIVIAAVAVVAAVLLAMWGLQSRAAFFYTPAEIAAGKAATGQPIRLGGMVEKGSIEHLPDGVTIRFKVGDGTAEVPVVFRGIVPDLFREGSGAVAEGRMSSDGIFVADNILAKHDERYMPPELGNQAAEHKAAKTVER